MSGLIIGVLLLGGVAWLLAGLRADQVHEEPDALKAWRARRAKDEAAKRASESDGHSW